MPQARHDIRQGDIVIVWASPPCQAYSRLQITGATKVSGKKPQHAKTEEGRRQADRAVNWLFMLCRCGPVCSLATFAAIRKFARCFVRSRHQQLDELLQPISDS